MTDIKTLQEQIKELITLRDSTSSKNMIDLFNKNIEDLEKQISLKQHQRKARSKREILEELGRVTEKKKKAESNNDLKEYKELEKKRKALKVELRDLNAELKYLTMTEFKQIIRAIEKHSNTPLRDKIMILLAFEGGFRVSEITDFKTEHFYSDLGEIYCDRKKGSVKGKIKINENLIKLIREYIRQESPGKILFKSNITGDKMTIQGLNYIFKKYCELANISAEKRHFHILKHTRGVWLSDKGFSIQEIKYLLGHKDVKSTMIYSSFSTIQKINIYEKLSAAKYL